MNNTTKAFQYHHAIAKKQLKGEVTPVVAKLKLEDTFQDIAFVEEELMVGRTPWSLYCVCDGHGGTAAARFVQEKLPVLLRGQLPSEPPPTQMRSKEGRVWAQKVSKQIAAVFCSLDEAFAQTTTSSGTTVSVALICGTLLTVANVGDSEVFLDTGFDILPMTDSHKVDTNSTEQTRLKEKGVTISSFISNQSSRNVAARRAIGPLRVWPGGIAISRSVGDFDCSPQVISNPHITQAILPGTGARLILATDGLWDHLTGKRACRLARRCLLSRAPTRLFRTLMTETSNCLLDDTTILIVDILPTHTSSADFALLGRNEKSQRLSAWSALKKLLGKIPRLGRQPTQLYARLDTSVAFPQINSRGHALYRESSPCLLASPAGSFRKRVVLYNEGTHRWNPDSEAELLPPQIPAKHRIVAQGV